MYIHFLASSLRSSGPTRQLLGLCTALKAGGLETQILTLKPESNDSLAPLFEAAQLDVRCVSGQASGGALKEIASVRKLAEDLRLVLREEGAEIIHSSGLVADMVAVRTGLPSVCTFRNDPWLDYAKKFGRLRGRILAELHVRTARKAIAPVACAKAVRMAFERRGLTMRTIQNGVDLNRFQLLPSQERAREDLGIPPRELLVVWIGSLVPRKDPLQAVVAAKNQGWNLVVAGEGPLMPEVRREAGDGVQVLGHVGDITSLLAASDVALSTSWGEGLPNTVLEAAAAGVPSALSEIPSHGEILEACPSVGTTFRAGDEADLVRAVEDAAAMQVNQKAFAAAFSMERVANEYKKLYGGLH